MYENVHPNLAQVLLFERTEVECGKGLFVLETLDKEPRCVPLQIFLYLLVLFTIYLILKYYLSAVL